MEQQRQYNYIRILNIYIYIYNSKRDFGYKGFSKNNNFTNYLDKRMAIK